MAKKTIKSRLKDTAKALLKGNLGDAIKEVTDAAGIEQCEECKQRQEAWNFGDKKMQVTEAEMEVLESYFRSNGQYLSSPVQKRLLSILDRIYGTKSKTTSCARCWRTKTHPKLEEVYKANK